MRDGVMLAADVRLPAGKGPWPAILLRTPYMRVDYFREPQSWLRLVNLGYALVAVDVRGRGDSMGEFKPFVADDDDGYDTVEWVAAQDWCSGHVGMIGFSYDALTQWWAARAAPPHLDCIVPMAVGVARTGPRISGDTGVPLQYWLWLLHSLSGQTYQNPGSPSWEAHWGSRPLRTLDERLGTARRWWPEYVDGTMDYLSPDFAFTEADWSEFHVPALIGVGWWDDQMTLWNWLAVQRSPAAASSRLLVGAWDHKGNWGPASTLGGLDVAASKIDIVTAVEPFLAVHLKDEQEQEGNAPPNRVFRTGAMAWEEISQWPAADARPTDLFIGGSHALTTEPPAVAEAVESYVYDPDHPVRDLVGLDDIAWADPPLDCRYLLRRADVLHHQTDLLTDEVKVSGEATLEVFISIDRPDSDIGATLYDVYPDGRCIKLAPAFVPPPLIRLAAHVPSGESLEPDRVYRFRLFVTWLHHTFLPGHRIGLLVTSSSYPCSARNLNGGEPWGDAVHGHPARITLHYGRDRPSRLMLPTERA